MKTKEVIAYLDSRLHPEYQEDYDNSGFLLGDGESEYTGSLVALDLTPAVVDEAAKMGASLIVTHHPFIFSGVKRLTTASETGRMVMSLMRNGISVYAAHTNLDNLPWGVSGALATRLGLKNVGILKAERVGDEEVGSGIVGDLADAESGEAFVARVKDIIGLPMVRYSGDLQRRVQRVALCGGAGAFLIGDAIAAGADIYLTADLKYHDFQRTAHGMILCDIGHYESEQFAKDIIFSVISEKFSNFACRISDVQQGIVSYI